MIKRLLLILIFINIIILQNCEKKEDKIEKENVDIKLQNENDIKYKKILQELENVELSNDNGNILSYSSIENTIWFSDSNIIGIKFLKNNLLEFVTCCEPETKSPGFYIIKNGFIIIRVDINENKDNQILLDVPMFNERYTIWNKYLDKNYLYSDEYIISNNLKLYNFDKKPEYGSIIEYKNIKIKSNYKDGYIKDYTLLYKEPNIKSDHYNFMLNQIRMTYQSLYNENNNIKYMKEYIIQLPPGHKIIILGEYEDDSKNIWYIIDTLFDWYDQGPRNCWILSSNAKIGNPSKDYNYPDVKEIIFEQISENEKDEIIKLREEYEILLGSIMGNVNAKQEDIDRA